MTNITDQKDLKDPAQAYDPEKYERPSVTADIVLFSIIDSALKVLLIKRKAWPFEGRLDEEELTFTLASQTLKLYQVSQPVQGEVSHKKGFWFSILGDILMNLRSGKRLMNLENRAN